MEWDEELSLGNDLLDDEDQEIIRLINALKAYGDSSIGSDSEFAKLLSSLRIEVGKHFIEEERLLKKNGCPASKLNEHIIDHALITLNLSETRYLTEKAVLHQKMPYLSEKLLSHMTTIDRECIPYLTH